MPNIQVFAGTSKYDDRQPTIVDHGYVATNHVYTTLYEIGLEYKTADYFPNRQVVIVINPDPNVKNLPPEVEEQLKNFADQLENQGTGLRGIGAQVAQLLRGE